MSDENKTKTVVGISKSEGLGLVKKCNKVLGESQKTSHNLLRDISKLQESLDNLQKGYAEVTENVKKIEEAFSASETLKEEKPVVNRVPKPVKEKVLKKAALSSDKKSETVSEDRRPALKTTVINILSNAKTSMTAAEIYNQCKLTAQNEKFDVWSRQSLYATLEKCVSKNEVQSVDDKFSVSTRLVETRIEAVEESFMKQVSEEPEVKEVS